MMGIISNHLQKAHYVKQLNKYKKKHYKRTSNLLTGESEKSPIEQSKADSLQFEVLNHWHPNITLNLAYDQQILSKGLHFTIIF